ncbi:hypothetical protein TI06_23580, partial [Vibrio vulnificus]
VRQAVAGVEDVVAEPGADAEHLARHQDDPEDADGQAHAGQHMAEDARQDHPAQGFPGRGGEATAQLQPARVELAHAG